MEADEGYIAARDAAVSYCHERKRAIGTAILSNATDVCQHCSVLLWYPIDLQVLARAGLSLVRNGTTNTTVWKEHGAARSVISLPLRARAQRRHLDECTFLVLSSPPLACRVAAVKSCNVQPFAKILPTPKNLFDVQKKVDVRKLV